MDDRPGEVGQAGSDDRPKFFKSINGWIAGVTGVVVALGGLTAAYRQIFPAEAQHQEQAVDQPDANAAATDANADACQSDADASEDPWSYTIKGGGTLSYQGNRWIEKDANGKVTSYDQQSVQDGYTYARNYGGGPGGEDIDLRWPTAGGQAQKSTDGQVNWTDAYFLTAEQADQPAAESDANAGE